MLFRFYALVAVVASAAADASAVWAVLGAVVVLAVRDVSAAEVVSAVRLKNTNLGFLFGLAPAQGRGFFLNG